MAELFIHVLNMSLCAGWVVLGLLVLRLFLKKAPKWITVSLWGIVGLRLICPVYIESGLSLIPSAEVIRPEIMLDRHPQLDTGVPMLDRALNPVFSGSFTPSPWASANPLQIWVPILSTLWVAGIVIMLLYTAVSYWRLRRQVATAVILREGIYQSQAIRAPFVLGVIKPKIYLPFAMDGQTTTHVIAHEQAHIRRRDHWWKPVGFLLLTLHWWNPLIWLAYILLCKDIELACDEKAIGDLTADQRADYSQALLDCSVDRGRIAACPLAFGEVDIRQRIRSVLHYKKPALWIIVAAVIVCIVLAVCFLTNPVARTEGQTSNAVAALQAKHPKVFELPTAKGLEVYIWQMAAGSYTCTIVPGRNTDYEWHELLHELTFPIQQMQTIVSYYLDSGVSRNEVRIYPIVMPHSSYYYVCDDAYKQRVTDLFWTVQQQN